MKTIFTKNNRHQLLSLLASATACVSCWAMLPNAVEAQTGVEQAPLGKRQTSDPYFSNLLNRAAQPAPRATASDNAKLTFCDGAWEHPASASSDQISRNAVAPAGQREVWKSLSRKVVKPVQRIDFSQFNTPKSAPKNNGTTSLAQHNRHAPVSNPLMPLAAPKVPAAVKAVSAFAPSASSKPDGSFTPKPVAVAVAVEAEEVGNIQQATFTAPVDGPYVPGQQLKKLGKRLKELSAAGRNESADVGYRIADTRTEYETFSDVPMATVDSSTSISAQEYRGESFELSEVVALVGGEPIFVGDMIFEVNQLLEKYMKGAPQEAKIAQRGNLIKRLLPKYVDQKLLYVATVSQLPEEANMEDILTQAEKTFNEKALPDIMEKSGVASPAEFDANLRAQGSSVRQMRRTWAKDQVSRYFLSEQVKFSEDVTHVDLLDEYRANLDSYAHNAKCRWEQIVIRFDKSGGRFAAKDKATDIYNRLVHGGNFQAIAQKESHGYKASAGGQHDWTHKGSLVNKKVDGLLFSMPQGRLSELIESKNAWHIVRVVERVDAYHTPFEEAQTEIREAIIDKRRDKAFKAYLAKLRDDIPVEYPSS